MRSQGGTNISENALSSCAEETVSTVRHIGIQHDGFYTPHIVPEIDGDKSVPRNTDKSKDQMRLETEVVKQVETRPVSSIQTNGQVMHYNNSLSTSVMLLLPFTCSMYYTVNNIFL